MTATVDLNINQGETFRKQFIWKTGELSVPVDLTGATARMQIRKTYAATDVLLSLTTENGITLGGSAGTIDLYVSDTATSAIAWEYGVYDLELVLSSGDVMRLLKGVVLVSKEVTR